MHRSPINPGPTTLDTPCPPWCNRRHPLDDDTDARIHAGAITARSIAITVEEHTDGHRLHLDEKDVEGALTPQDALALSYALEVAATTISGGQR